MKHENVFNWILTFAFVTAMLLGMTTTVFATAYGSGDEVYVESLSLDDILREGAVIKSRQYTTVIQNRSIKISIGFDQSLTIGDNGTITYGGETLSPQGDAGLDGDGWAITSKGFVQDDNKYFIELKSIQVHSHGSDAPGGAAFFEPWDSDNTLPRGPGDYCLTTDVTLSQSWTAPSGTTNICLNGHGIRLDAQTGCVISVGAGGVLNIYDCGNTTHYYTPAEGGAGLAGNINDSNGEAQFQGGYITGGRGSSCGGIFINSGAVTMNGGTIIGNVATNNESGGGGGVYITKDSNCQEGGLFTMNGGAIIGNAGRFGGGVCAFIDSSFIMNGGSISSNAAGRDGGGVYVYSDCSFDMNGGIIIENTAGRNGGGVYAGGNFTMTSGRIFWNAATQGGGVYCAGNDIAISGDPEVFANKCGTAENNVYLPSSRMIKVKDYMTTAGVICVTMQVPGVFINGALPYVTSLDFDHIFHSDDPSYNVVLDGSDLKLQLIPAEITEEPETNDRFYDGEEQPLLKTAGKAEGGTLYYAVGSSDSAPEDGDAWSTSIPTGKEQKLYYVWVKAVGDDNHSDSAAKRYVSKIAFPVTFKVKHGNWSDEKGGADDRVVTLDRYEAEDLLLKLEPEDIPKVGDDPGEGYTEGSWDETPSTDKAISEEKTFTYSYREIHFIKTADDWNALAKAIEKGYSTKGEFYKLDADIKISTMLGTSGHPFEGEFDGAGHRLIVDIRSEDTAAAPFGALRDGTIRNVRVEGTIEGAEHSAGLVAKLDGTCSIWGCDISATITAENFCGGIVGLGESGDSEKITGCVFRGIITDSKGSVIAGAIYGWRDITTNIVVERCLEDGIYGNDVNLNPVGLGMKDEPYGTQINFYVNDEKGDPPQSWEFHGDKVYKVKNNGGVTVSLVKKIEDDRTYESIGLVVGSRGAVFNGTAYAQAGFGVKVTLPSACDDCTVKKIVSGDTVALSGKTPDYTFTMPAEDVAIEYKEGVYHKWKFTGFKWIGNIKDGYTGASAEYTCENDETHKASIDVPSASFSAVETKPTCTEAGYTTYKAAVTASESLDGQAHEAETTGKPEEMLEHKWIDATCTTPKTCSVCGATSGDPLGHDWGDWQVTKEPAPNKDGVRTRVCKNDSSHVETEKIAASGKLLTKMTTKGKKALVITWTKMNEADGYEVYFTKCNHKSKKNICKKIKTVSAGKALKYTKKKLKKQTSYKAFVMAYKFVDGQKVYMDTSLTVHCYTTKGNKKYTNPKAVKVENAKFVLDKGKTAKIKAAVTKQKNGKKIKLTNHTAKKRYISSNKSIATVNKSGKIKAKAAGSCKVYVIAANGVRKTVKVTVK